MGDRSSIQAVLLVEGVDESDVVAHLCKTNAIEGIEIVVLKGRDDLMARAKAVVADSKYRDVARVGIIYDSEENPAQTRAVLEKAERILSNPPRPKTVRVLQLPAPDQCGSFEALCLQAIAANDPVLGCCDQFIRCLDGKPHKLSTQARKDKARLLIWYAATMGKPISRIGRDANQGDKLFDYAHTAFQPLVSFLQTLVA